MSRRYTIKPKADLDLDQYCDYLAQADGFDLAVRFLDAANSTFALLATQPAMGWRSRTRYPGLELLRVFRVSGFPSMLVLYRPISGGVEIVRVVHGARNLLALLRREGF